MLYNRKFFFVLAIIFVCLQSHQSIAASNGKKIVDSAKAVTTMWKAIKGNTENDGSYDAYIGVLIATQLAKMNGVDIAENGELYINGINIKDPRVGLLYIDQHAELLGPVFVQDGGYVALNQVLLEEAKGGAFFITQHLESRGRLNVGHGAKLGVNEIRIINQTRER